MVLDPPVPKHHCVIIRIWGDRVVVFFPPFWLGAALLPGHYEATYNHTPFTTLSTLTLHIIMLHCDDRSDEAVNMFRVHECLFFFCFCFLQFSSSFISERNELSVLQHVILHITRAFRTLMIRITEHGSTI